MSKNPQDFSQFHLNKALLSTIQTLGYETPTPVQVQSIPILQQGDDLLAQAQTGTGKTAAFALPILNKINVSAHKPQALVLAPTRELAIQVAENFQAYAKNMSGFKAIAIYGGQDFSPQLRALKKGGHVIVGTPGRLMDHLRRGNLDLENVETLIIDEADEMLKMGFIDDVEWILSHITKAHQTALFSATLPNTIVKIAEKYLKNPKRVSVKSQKNAIETIAQYCVNVPRDQKFAVLMRFLALEENQGVIVFARTKSDSTALSEKLQAHGYKAAALNGDMSQASREKTIDRLKKGLLNIVVATDVAARGLDVERITHVFNYDMPFDMDSYVHRIGRTGRAGREGKAILFVTPREKRFVSAIERHTNKPIKLIDPPDAKHIETIRLKNLATELSEVITHHRDKLEDFVEVLKTISHECKCSSKDISAALLYLKSRESHFEDNYQPTPEKKNERREFSRDRKSRPHRDRRDFSPEKREKREDGKKDFSGSHKRKDKKRFSEKRDDQEKKPWAEGAKKRKHKKR